jgi:hypothetical protein
MRGSTYKIWEDQFLLRDLHRALLLHPLLSCKLLLPAPLRCIVTAPVLPTIPAAMSALAGWLSASMQAAAIAPLRRIMLTIFSSNSASNEPGAALRNQYDRNCSTHTKKPLRQ